MIRPFVQIYPDCGVELGKKNLDFSVLKDHALLKKLVLDGDVSFISHDQ
jgi:hypothetical protein